MGLIRKSLHVATVGAVAPNSKKQRVAKRTLVAIQGGTPEQVRRAGGRYEYSLASLLGGGSRHPRRSRVESRWGARDPKVVSLELQRAKSEAAYEAWKQAQP
jgi:hypothetical protein